MESYIPGFSLSPPDGLFPAGDNAVEQCAEENAAGGPVDGVHPGGTAVGSRHDAMHQRSREDKEAEIMDKAPGAFADLLFDEEAEVDQSPKIEPHLSQTNPEWSIDRGAKRQQKLGQ